MTNEKGENEVGIKKGGKEYTSGNWEKDSLYINNQNDAGMVISHEKVFDAIDELFKREM